MSNPLGHISGIIYTQQALLDGMTVVIFNRPTVDYIMASVARYQIAQLIFGANNATEIANTDFEKKYNLSSLEMLKYGSSKIAGNLLMKIKEKYKVSDFLAHLAKHCRRRTKI